eukprot:Selendium_serpulae@DN6417_c1_g1_i2.p2
MFYGRMFLESVLVGEKHVRRTPTNQRAVVAGESSVSTWKEEGVVASGRRGRRSGTAWRGDWAPIGEDGHCPKRDGEGVNEERKGSMKRNGEGVNEEKWRRGQ